ncbi:hypothetical protein MKY20_24245 [Cytobacillus sp. FSL W8-0315]|uniref:hypothetical protein n=1 Tax=Cytobacillus TaxID=2675230 RepID=UPI00054FB11E|nr:hypothetical protein [Cytobacillus pseudoceanisediminis]UQX57140.1 hypothetical protein M5V91_28780 [Cytobacillus pseudoceanisediminis]
MNTNVSKEIKYYILFSVSLFIMILFLTRNNISVIFKVMSFIILVALIVNIIALFIVNTYHRENAILRNHLKNKHGEDPNSIISQIIDKKDKKSISRFTYYLMVGLTVSYIIYAVLFTDDFNIGDIFTVMVNVSTLLGILVILEDRSK